MGLKAVYWNKFKINIFLREISVYLYFKLTKCRLKTKLPNEIVLHKFRNNIVIYVDN